MIGVIYNDCHVYLIIVLLIPDLKRAAVNM